jgi:hypothetical protein
MRELADSELWCGLTRLDPRDDGSDDDARLRLAVTVELRDYKPAIHGWLRASDAPQLPQGEPARHRNFVLFWRDRDHVVRRTVVGAVDVRVLAVVRAKLPLASLTAYRRERVESTVRALVGLGVLLGRFP